MFFFSIGFISLTFFTVEQPAAIRKLLTGNVSLSPSRGGDGGDTPPSRTTPISILHRNQHPTDSLFPGMNPVTSHSPTATLTDLLGHSVSSPFAVTAGGDSSLRNNQNNMGSTAVWSAKKNTNNTPTNHSRSAKKQKNANQQVKSFSQQQPQKQQQQQQQQQQQPKQSPLLLSDFNFSSTAFTNFRFNYNQILSVL